MKTEDYLNQNPIVKNFIDKVNSEITTYYQQQLSNSEPKLVTASIGTKFIKLEQNGSVWGFISRFDGFHKGVPVRKGDLLKAADWRTPAKHSRGNIINGTEQYGVYGPTYLK